jgi:hypothetical protein
MERAQPLSDLVNLIATIRSQSRTTRLSLHNTERFGLIHLSFEHGRLIRVDGNAGGPSESLFDLESWRHGAVRIESITAGTVEPASALPLDALLDTTLRHLERAGVVHSAPPAVSVPGSLPDLTADRFSSSGPEADAVFVSAIPTVPTLPSATLPDAVLNGAAPLATQVQSRREGDVALTDPQWQLLALAVRQIADQAAIALGPQAAQAMLVDALAQAGGSSAFLRQVTIDGTGWLRRQESTGRGAVSTFEATQAIATLLAVLESYYATRLGAQRVRRLITSAVAPLRNSLEQIGLTVVGN